MEDQTQDLEKVQTERLYETTPELHFYLKDIFDNPLVIEQIKELVRKEGHCLVISLKALLD